MHPVAWVGIKSMSSIVAGISDNPYTLLYALQFENFLRPMWSTTNVLT
jgi:hypothetical protein